MTDLGLIQPRQQKTTRFAIIASISSVPRHKGGQKSHLSYL